MIIANAGYGGPCLESAKEHRQLQPTGRAAHFQTACESVPAGEGSDYQRNKDVKLGEALIRLQYLNEDQLAETLSAQKNLPVIPLNELYPNPRAVNLLSERFIRSRRVLPIDFEGDSLVLAMVAPLDVVTPWTTSA